MTNVDWYILVAIVALVAGDLLFIPPRYFRRKRGITTDALVADEIDAAAERLGRAVQHHTQVNAILALTEQFADNPQLLLNLALYSREVVGSALLYRVNAIGHDISELQEELSRERSADLKSFSVFRGDRAKELNSKLDQLHQELRAANEAVQKFSGTQLRVIQ